jgi:response regulator of citrate/malate metabolism
MLIGKGFNKKCEQILSEAAEISDYESGYTISVEELNKNLGFGRKEIRYYFEYMSDQKLIELTTIGGPFLYGHITLTDKGVAKIKAIQKRLE